MDSSICMNVLCGTNLSTSVEWKKGWTLRSGECANLCHDCGSAYEQSVFCDEFHSKESGWRECTCCGKWLHCGCIASSCLLELVDIGGVECIGCAKKLGPLSIACDEKRIGLSMKTINDITELQTTALAIQTDSNGADKMELMPCISDGNGFKESHFFQNGDTDGSIGKIQQEEVITGPKKTDSKCVSYSNIGSPGSSLNSRLETIIPTLGVNHANESITQTNLSITFGDPSGNSIYFPSARVDEREQSKTYSTVPQGPRSRQLLPKPPKSASPSELDINAEIIQHLRVARPPVEGRGRNQLLPRYWPRITDQELQQISGDSNCKVVPLFEKILSASDASRIGRLVLPKACAEAYFPPISQPEGIPLKVEDVKGKEWVFQFRFWPNNNSRMYVLEGVTPCIQSMQLQAGDTVTFSRMDPEEKLIMGFRKASKSVYVQSLTGSTNPNVHPLRKGLLSTCEDSRWQDNDMHGSAIIGNLILQAMLVPERNTTRNIGSKSKRLLMDCQDALELKYTWDEVQDMLQPPPSVRASVVTIEDQDFEEYEEPPVLGKRSIFIVRASGRQEQWVQCDNCGNWRRLPVDVLLPSRWTCAENCWDPDRRSCSARDELTPRELQNLLKQNNDFRKCKMATSNGSISENKSSGLNALAKAAVLGNDPETSISTTTKHPRHRPGCSCIVCIQPPSGKGKHKPTCTCNVCMTVRRRFKTLMMRKKKRQSDREAEIAQRTTNLIGSPNKDPSDDDLELVNLESESKSESNFSPNKFAETTGKGYIDLNSHPGRKEEDIQVGLATRLSMTSLVQIASFPLETYLKKHGLTSLINEKQTSSGSHILPQVIGDRKDHLNEDRYSDSEKDETPLTY